jgi:DNA polymerase
MMTREDMMRELELLPVWQLRSPLPTQTQASPQVQEAPVESLIAEQVKIDATVLKTETIVEELVEQKLVEIVTKSEFDVTLEPTSVSEELTYISSDDGDWLFVFSSSVMSDEEQQLFQNMCKALHIKPKPPETSSNALTLIDEIHPKLLLAMGEVTAQTILHSVESIESLRGRAHQLHGVTFIATYDLAYLLHNPAVKANTWNDLCIGLQVLQDLKVANT